MVREGEHDGDPAELHHSRDVPALRRRPVRHEPLQDIAGNVLIILMLHVIVQMKRAVCGPRGKGVGVESHSLLVPWCHHVLYKNVYSW